MRQAEKEQKDNQNKGGIGGNSQGQSKSSSRTPSSLRNLDNRDARLVPLWKQKAAESGIEAKVYKRHLVAEHMALKDWFEATSCVKRVAVTATLTIDTFSTSCCDSNID